MQTLPPTNRSVKLVLIDPTSKERFDRIRAGLPASIEVVAVADASDEELERHISDADMLLVGRRSIDDRLLDMAPNVRFIQKSNAGYDMIDIEALKRRGVIMANNAGGNSTPVAEYTVMMMLALLKRLVPSVEATRSGRWPRGEFSRQRRPRGLPRGDHWLWGNRAGSSRPPARVWRDPTLLCAATEYRLK